MKNLSLKKIIQANKQVLVGQSRSFSIPILNLDKDLKYPVMAQYNINKTLDTIEDSRAIPPHEKITLMRNYINCLAQNQYPEEVVNRMLSITPENESFVFKHQREIIEMFSLLDDKVKDINLKWSLEMTEGMCNFWEVEIKTAEQLDEYCYYVAGTVGLFLTDMLFLKGQDVTQECYQYLLDRAVDFGLFLQKINIIRDYWEDTYLFNRKLWPQEYFEHSHNQIAILNCMCEQTLFKHGVKAIEYFDAIPEGNKSFEVFIKYVLRSGLEYLKILRNNNNVFMKDKVMLPKLFFLTLLKDVKLTSHRKFKLYCDDLIASERELYSDLPLM